VHLANGRWFKRFLRKMFFEDATVHAIDQTPRPGKQPKRAGRGAKYWKIWTRKARPQRQRQRCCLRAKGRIFAYVRFSQLRSKPKPLGRSCLRTLHQKVLGSPSRSRQPHTSVDPGSTEPVPPRRGWQLKLQNLQPPH